MLNKSANQILNNPIFLMKKLIHKWTFRREPNGLV